MLPGVTWLWQVLAVPVTGFLGVLLPGAQGGMRNRSCTFAMCPALLLCLEGDAGMWHCEPRRRAGLSLAWRSA